MINKRLRIMIVDPAHPERLIIDNNTKDPAVWEPVRDYCETLGPRFKFFHVAPLAGFKGGEAIIEAT
ncbi:hypothetical protein, partial [Klebsiella pneumoniae]|uniref:hypothetical protein n=1 Tax=Klebsiella pneumoniae TaxID=573 RepID=UPI00272F0EBA